MNQLREIRKGLKYGDIRRMANELHVTPEFVSQVLRGISKSEKVLELAIEVADQNKKSKKALEKRIKQVLSK